MTIIHMDTDQVDELGRTLMRSATDILDLEESLKYATLRLQNAWLGDRADQTRRQLNSVSSQLSSLANRMDDLAKLTIHESQQWLEVDGSNQSLGSAWWQNAKNNVGDLIEDLPKFGGAAYIISTLHSVPARPNSVALHGSGWKLKLIGLGPHRYIMTPSTIQKQLLGSSYVLTGGLLAGVTDGIHTGADTFFSDDYAGTSRAFPAAVVDGAVKGVATGLVTALLIYSTGAIIGTAAAPVAVAAATIGVCVVGGSLLNTFAVDPLFKIWQASHLHAQVVEGATRLSNDVADFFQYKVQSEMDFVRNYFTKFISPLSFSPA